MAREISIHEVSQDALRVELKHVVQYFLDLGHDQCEVAFGWRWGMEYPPAEPWGILLVPLEAVSELLENLEKLGSRIGF